MNIRVAKEEMALMLPGSLSQFAPADYAPAGRSNGFAARLRSAVQWFAELPRRRAVMEELASLTDRELADIGLTRDNLSDVFNPEFASRRAA